MFYYYFVPFVGSAAGLVNSQLNYQQQTQLQQFCSSGCHGVFYGGYGYLVPVQTDLFFRQNNQDFQLWKQAQRSVSTDTKKLEGVLSVHDYDVKNLFGRVLDVLDKRVTDQDGEIKDIKEKLDEISSKLSSIESKVERPKVSIPGVTIISASSFTTSPTPTATEQVPSTPSPTLSEEDKQGQFLYKLSQKLFDSLKLNSESELSKNPKDNVVKGLKDKFFSSLENEEDKGENFKSLCETQKEQETQSGDLVYKDHARLCFVDTGDDPKGDLNEGNVKGSNPHISPDGNKAFEDLSQKNYELGNSFKTKYPDANPVDKFDEGYSSTEHEPTMFKNVMNKVSGSSS